MTLPHEPTIEWADVLITLDAWEASPYYMTNGRERLIVEFGGIGGNPDTIPEYKRYSFMGKLEYYLTGSRNLGTSRAIDPKKLIGGGDGKP